MHNLNSNRELCFTAIKDGEMTTGDKGIYIQTLSDVHIYEGRQVNLTHSRLWSLFTCDTNIALLIRGSCLEWRNAGLWHNRYWTNIHIYISRSGMYAECLSWYANYWNIYPINPAWPSDLHIWPTVGIMVAYRRHLLWTFSRHNQIYQRVAEQYLYIVSSRRSPKRLAIKSCTARVH